MKAPVIHKQKFLEPGLHTHKFIQTLKKSATPMARPPKALGLCRGLVLGVLEVSPGLLSGLLLEGLSAVRSLI